MASSLQAQADDTLAQLSRIFDELGVEAPERAEYTRALWEDIAAVFRSRIESQLARRAGTSAEIDTLRRTIADMHHAMEQEEVLPPQGALPLLQYRSLLDAARGALQEVRK